MGKRNGQRGSLAIGREDPWTCKTRLRTGENPSVAKKVHTAQMFLLLLLLKLKVALGLKDITASCRRSAKPRGDVNVESIIRIRRRELTNIRYRQSKGTLVPQRH